MADGLTHDDDTFVDAPLRLKDSLEAIRVSVIGLVTITQACNRWINRQPPDLEEVRRLLKLMETNASDLLRLIPGPPED